MRRQRALSQTSPHTPTFIFQEPPKISHPPQLHCICELNCLHRDLKTLTLVRYHSNGTNALKPVEVSGFDQAPISFSAETHLLTGP